MSIVLSALWTLLVLLFLLLARTEVVYRAHIKEIVRVSYLAEKCIENSVGDWEALFRRYDDRANYDRHLFDLTKWTHKQFFPDDYRETEIGD